MSLSLPKDIRTRIQDRIWAKADELDWTRLSDLERANWYENWSKDKDIGGVLAHFMDPRKVRVYIKDSLFKPYHRSRLQSDESRIFSILNVDTNVAIEKYYSKPYGRLFADGRIICWGNSRDWKAIIMSVFERAWEAESSAGHAAALIETGKTSDSDVREMVRDIAKRLGLSVIVWLD